MAKLPTTRRIFDVVGESHDNADGSNRQDELLECEPGETIGLVREPQNPHDPNAVLVLSARDVGIGYLAREDSALIAPAIDAGRPFTAKLHCLRGGVPGAASYGAKVSIAWDGRPEHGHEPLYDEQIIARAGKRGIKGRQRDASGRLVAAKQSGCMGILVFGLVASGGLLSSWLR